MTYTGLLNFQKRIILPMIQTYSSLIKKIKSIQAKLNKDLKGLYKWLLANKISLNAAKTELVIFRKPSWSLPITQDQNSWSKNLTISFHKVPWSLSG